MFTIKGVGQGLSISAAVENMQRHILEYGPIYVTKDRAARTLVSA